MMSDDPYHWHPELLATLIDVIPLLCRSKEDVLSFLRGAGVPEAMLADWRRRLATDRNAVKKYDIVRQVLTRLNEQSDGGLGARRALLHRVTEFEEFSTCWPDDRLKAKGLVAEVRQLVNVKDSFTRIRQEREADQRGQQAQRQAVAERAAQRRCQCRDLHAQLAALFSETNAHRRGLALEKVLNGVFAMDGVLIREAFVLRSEDGQAVEQIDGAIELDGAQYLVEMKWWAEPLGIDAVSRHLVRVYGRGEVRGLFISASGFAPPAVLECEKVLTQRVIVLSELQELVMLLEREENVARWLREKVRGATVERKPLTRPGMSPP